MKSRTIFITYFILTITLLASAVVFAFEIKHFMRHRGVDPTAEYQMQLNQDEIVKEELNRKKELSRQEVTQSFGQTQAFVAIATPKPRPTPPPRPTPKPTPVEAGKNWKIIMAFGSSVQLQRYDKEIFIKKQGEVLQDDVHGDFKILEIYKNDPQNPKIKVQHIKTGTTRIMDKNGKTVNQ